MFEKKVRFLLVRFVCKVESFVGVFWLFGR